MPISDAQILVIDDEPDLRTLYELTLLREGYRVAIAATLDEAREQLAVIRFDVIITDMRLPDGLGLELLQLVQMQQRPERCIVITAYGSAENAVEALKAGAFDYLTKPVDLKQFRAVVASAVRRSPGSSAPYAPTPLAGCVVGTGQDLTELGELSRELNASGQQALARLVGTSQAMCHVKRRVAKIARSMAPVLVRGESGTGKELIASAIHACSHRSDGPFVAVNCGAIPENLLEAEFFGAKKGSYTGSTQDRLGYFQAARQGTLFLDEIGDLPLAMQSKLLRAIQERKVRALGSTQEEAADVRIVSATHKDLVAEVQAGRFRQDLYYRLNVIEIISPPLRERRDDLPALCTALLERIARDSGTPVHTLSPQALTQLHDYPLPGNVRELENLLHRAVALSDSQELDFEDVLLPLPTEPQPSLSPYTPEPEPELAPAPTAPPSVAAPALGAAHCNDLPSDLQAWLDQQEREMLIRALQTTDYNRTAAAALLGLNLRQIRYRMSRLLITAPGHNGPDFDDSVTP